MLVSSLPKTGSLPQFRETEKIFQMIPELQNVEYLATQSIVVGKQREVVYRWQRWWRRMDIQWRAAWTRKGENGCGMSRMRKLALWVMREMDEVVAGKAESNWLDDVWCWRYKRPPELHRELRFRMMNLRRKGRKQPTARGSRGSEDFVRAGTFRRGWRCRAESSPGRWEKERPPSWLTGFQALSQLDRQPKPKGLGRLGPRRRASPSSGGFTPARDYKGRATTGSPVSGHTGETSGKDVECWKGTGSRRFRPRGWSGNRGNLRNQVGNCPLGSPESHGFSTAAPLPAAGAFSGRSVIATALAAGTPRHPSGGNHRNDAHHWLRGCSSCGDSAHHWLLGRGAGFFGRIEGTAHFVGFAVTMVTTGRTLATSGIHFVSGHL